MNTSVTCFNNRRQAGQLLAAALGKYAHQKDLLILGLPRGGVPVAFEVARALRAPLDVITVRKLGVPGWEELAMGAISCGGLRLLNEDVIRSAEITPEQIKAVTARELRELHRREAAYRGRSGAPAVTGKTVILIDDGIATGSTVQVAIKVLRAQDPTAIVMAVPTASPAAAKLLEPEVDEFVALLIPEHFHSVGEWYEDFSPTSDAEVRELIAQARQIPVETTAGD